MPDYLEPVVNTLNQIADTRLVWPGGLLHQGGPHRRIAGMLRPISIGEDECRVFATLIEAFCPAHCFVIGNAFGFSSAYIAQAMMEHGGESIVTLDSQREGNGARCAAIAERLAERLELSILRNKKGVSPIDIPRAIEVPIHQLIFIDGGHSHPQVTLDFEGILPYSEASTLFVWHDLWLPAVTKSLQAACDRGFRCLWIPTSCEMVIGTRDAATFRRLQRSFPGGRVHYPAHPRLLHCRVAVGLALKYAHERAAEFAPRELVGRMLSKGLLR